MTIASKPQFLIADPEWQAPTETCCGPDPSGICPRAVTGHAVPCAARDLILLNSDLSARWSLAVGPREDECPLLVMFGAGA